MRGSIRLSSLVLSLAVAAAAPAQQDGAAAGLYNQPYRPQVHFSPQQHWTNDPNGLIFYKGEYHLFYQYNPFGDVWGHMSWGHAISKDLLHWKEYPVAIPEANGVMIFTGSVVVDHANRSGLCADAAGSKAECLVAVYTGYTHIAATATTRESGLQTQNIAYSRDAGRTWVKYEHNPVLDLHMVDFRDPSVSWDAKQQRWIMAVSLPLEHKVRFYGSGNLKDWTQMSEFGPAGYTTGDWECPDLLYVPADKAGQQGTWALKVGLNPGAPQGGSGEQYFLGSFDGTRFTVSPAPGARGLTNYGKDDYCAISFNGLPAGRKPVLIGWMSNWQYAAKLPTAPWRGQMSIPRELSLVRDADGMALKQQPVTAPLRYAAMAVDAQLRAGAGAKDKEVAKVEGPFELALDFDSATARVFGLRVYSDDQHFTEIGFDRGDRVFYIDRTHSGAEVDAKFAVRTVAPLAAQRKLDLRLITDRSSVEAYAQGGTIAMTNLVFPAGERSRIELFSSSDDALTARGQLWKLHSIWEQ